MKKLSILILMVAVSLTCVLVVHAQAAETLWMQADTTDYKTNETVTVTLHAISATPVQGFTAQIRYDPACLEPVNGTSPISGMSGLALPQAPGLADVSFASTTPLTANGLLAEVHFTALKGCQTRLYIETAALVVRNESGFAAPVSGVNINHDEVTLNVDNAQGSPQPTSPGESVLPLAPTVFSETKPINWQMILWLGLAGVLVASILGLYKVAGSRQ